MEKDKQTIQWLNLLHTSPSFVIRANEEKITVQSLKQIPNNDGEYWVYGITQLKNSFEVPSVFRVDTDSGGSLLGVYWLINNIWWDFMDRPCVYKALELEEVDIFPFDWKESIPLELNIFKDT